MITTTTSPSTNIIEMDIAGEVTAEELAAAMDLLRKSIEEHGSVRLLKRIQADKLPKFPMSKIWDDVKFSYQHLGQITHAAVVTDHRGAATMTSMMNPLFKMKMKCFPNSDIDEAREWLATADTNAQASAE
ncbi:SpoIIAA family protein [Rubinisphaera margarita]|uniref:STAS/SEC14 domain-containing protein n=1 Tax=Rubinisphaera margarita TaxID=2909586 RepID=UPI001EE961E3|nr:STAS/SEC14 domain-containing protein [Rubinisphaera margarita]MCG6156339.1 STAS/SEC14 domain-containing protein [Rubinisphaera margarita]